MKVLRKTEGRILLDRVRSEGIRRICKRRKAEWYDNISRMTEHRTVRIARDPIGRRSIYTSYNLNLLAKGPHDSWKVSFVTSVSFLAVRFPENRKPLLPPPLPSVEVRCFPFICLIHEDVT